MKLFYGKLFYIREYEGVFKFFLVVFVCFFGCLKLFYKVVLEIYSSVLDID